MNYIFLLVLSVFLTSCGDQDPLKDFDQSVREAIPISEKIKIPSSVPISSDSLVIDAPEVVNFTEGVEGQFKVSGRLLGIDVDYQIRITNPPPGMVFDRETGEVSWTPPLSTVTSDNTYSKYFLNVDLIAYDEGEVLTTRKVVVIFVNIDSAPLAPHLLDIVPEPRVAKFTEGRAGTLKLIGRLFGGVNAPYKIEVLNPPPGAEVEPTGDGAQLRWTPSYSTVKGIDQFSSYPLRVKLVAEGEDGKVSIEKTVDLGVYVASTPLSKHLLNIVSTPEHPRFTEGVEGKFVISGKLLGEMRASHEVKILNLPKGAIQKAVKGGGIEVTWTPPVDTLVGVNEFTTTYNLNVQLKAQNEEGEVSTGKTIPLGIYVNGPPLTSDSMIIDVEPKILNFKEGTEGKFVISARILGSDNISHELKILNLPQGATQKAAKGGGIEVTWTPSALTVSGENYFNQRPLNIQLTAEKDGESATKEISVPLWVSTDTGEAPVIQDVTFSKTPLLENEKGTMTINVSNKSTGAPFLHFIPTAQGSRNGLYYIDHYDVEPVQDENDPTLWRYKVGIDFKGRNVVLGGSLELRLGVVAYSRYGLSSHLHDFSYNVLNRVAKPQGGFSNVRLPYGRDLEVTFNLYDPRGEGVITSKLEQACQIHLVKKYRCRCEKIEKLSGRSLKCNIKWFAYRGAPSKIKFSYSVTNTNPHDPADSATTRKESLIELYLGKYN